MSIRVFYDILNQKGTPAFYTDTLANRPAFGYAGRVFISTDSGQIFEDTGSAWTLIADAGVGGGTLSSVCLNGNTTATGIVITAGGLSSNSITNTGLTTGSVLFAGTGGLESQSNSAFFWDNTNKRLGIGNAAPGAPLDVHGTGTQIQINGTGTNNSYIQFQNAGTSKWRIGNNYNAGANSFDIFNNGLSNTPFSINSSTNLITLTANVTTTGIQSVQNGLNLGYASGGSVTNYTNVSGSTSGINFALGNGTGGANFIFQTLAGYTYTFPATTGTLALTSDLSSYVPTSRTLTINGTAFDLSVNRSWSVGTVTSVAALTIGTTGTDITSSVATGTTTPVITLNVPTASATNRGALSSADWTSFNNKQNALTNPITGTGVANQVSIFNGTTSVIGASNLTFDNTNARLGVNASSFTLTAQVTSYSTTQSNQFKAAGTAPGYTFSDATNSVTYGGAIGGATAANNFITGSAAGDICITNQSLSAGAILFGIGTSEKMRLTSTGSLGIGRTSPSYTLDINGTLGTSGAVTIGGLLTAQVNNNLFGTASATGRGIRVQASSDGGAIQLINAAGGDGTIIATGTSTTMNYQFNTYSTGNALVINNNGKVGIGLSNPDSPLTVTNTTGGNVINCTSSGGSPQLQIGAPNATGSNANLYMECAGIFGAGFYTDRASSTFRGWCGTSTNGVQLAGGGTSWGSYSDERLKDIIEPISDALNKVNTLRAIIGKYKTDEINKRRVFLIAQDVQKVLPEAIFDDKSEEKILSLQYTDIIPLLVKAIQELNEKLVRNNIN